VRNPRLWGARKPTLTVPQIDDLVLWITLGIIVGGRLGYVLFYMLPSPVERPFLFAHPLELFELWHGGMSFHGGMIGVALALVAFARINRVDLLLLADLVAPCQPIGQFFGRIANFINGELWGRPTTLPWGIIFPGAGPEPRHPSELYEAGLEGLVLFLLLRWSTHGRHDLNRRGVVMGLFIAGYGLARTSLENVREPDSYMPNFPFGLTMGMILSIPMIAVGAWMVWRGIKEGPRNDGAPVATPKTVPGADEPA
jgi:phosphatidylglycerol---prolipoprotein diacylglyceryl transferase